LSWVIVLMVRRWRTATPVVRRALRPVRWAARPVLGLLVLSFVAGPISDELSTVFASLALLSLAVVPYAFLFGLLQGRFAPGAVAAARLSLHRNRLQAELRARLTELQLERDFIADVVNASPAFFCVTDLEGRIIRYNEPLARVTGRVDDEHTRGRPFWEVFPV